MKVGRKTKIDWNCKKTISILLNDNLSLREMCDILGYKSIYHISRKRKELGISPLIGEFGTRTPLTNKERKKRYNEKIKLNGYKPLYKTSKK